MKLTSLRLSARQVVSQLFGGEELMFPKVSPLIWTVEPDSSRGGVPNETTARPLI